MGIKRVYLSAGISIVFALCWAAPAAADGVCKANESPCGKGNAWPVGTVLSTGIKAGTEILLKGSFQVRCTSSSWSGELTQNPTEGIAALLKGLSETFAGCKVASGSCSVKASEFWGGAKWFADAKSPGNGYTGGTLPVARYVEVLCAGVSCKWEISSSEASTHTYQGGNPAFEVWSWRYVKNAGSAFCGTEMTMSGEREFLTPEGSVFWTVS